MKSERTDIPTDEELLEAYRAGDNDSFAALVRRYEKELYNFLHKFLGKPALAEEVFQEAFLQVHLSIDRFERSRRFRPWLYTIAANKARDLIRHRARRPAVHLTALDDENGKADLWDSLLREETTAADIVESKERHQLVRQTVDDLPEHLREILILAYFNQISYKEMAETLSIPLGTVKSRLHAAVATFAKEYGKNAGEKRE